MDSIQRERDEIGNSSLSLPLHPHSETDSAASARNTYTARSSPSQMKLFLKKLRRKLLSYNSGLLNLSTDFFLLGNRSQL